MVNTFFNCVKKVSIMNENYTGWLVKFYKKQNSTKYPRVKGYFYQKIINIELTNINKKNTFFKFL